MNRRHDDEPPEPKQVESPGGFWDGCPYEQIVNKERKYAFLIYRKKPQILPPNADWRSHYVVTDSILESGEYPPTNYVPMKRLPWRVAGSLPEEMWSKEFLWVQIRQFLFDHIDLPDLLLYDVLTAWTFATWILEKWMSVPYLFFLGPVDSGKTRALDTLAALCFRGLQSNNMSGSSIFRGVEKWKPTLFLDETEIYNQKERMDVIGVLNAGYRKGQYAVRVGKTNGEKLELELFDVYGFKALAGTKSHKETLESRSIIVNMFRASRKVNFIIDYRKAQEIRTQLLLWRMDQLSDPGTGEFYLFDVFYPSPEGLAEIPEALSFADGRFAEKYYPLYTVSNEGQEAIIEYAKKQYRLERLAHESSDNAEVIQSIIKCRDKMIKGILSTREIAQVFNEPRTDKEKWKTNSVGRLMRGLGFNKSRTTTGVHGWIIDDDTLERNMRRFGLSFDEDVPGDNGKKGKKGKESGAGVGLGDIYPEAIMDELCRIGKSHENVVKKVIKGLAPEWEDYKVEATVEQLEKDGYLFRTFDGLIPVRKGSD